MNLVRLDRICSINMGQSPSSDSYNTVGRGMPFFQGNADFGAINPVARTWCDNPKKTADQGDILISVRAPIGAINVANEPCCIGRGLAGITVDGSKACTGYVVHVLKAKRDSLEKLGTGSTFKAINKKTLSKFEIPLCSLPLQQRISAQLDSIECQISEYEYSKMRLDHLVKSRFFEMFDQYIKSNAAHVPIESVCETFCDGNWIESKDQSSEGIRLVQTGNIGNGVYKDNASRSRYISFETYRRLGCTPIYAGDVLISRLPDPVGRACILPKGIGNAITAVDCSILRFNNMCLPEYFVAFTFTPLYAARIATFETGTTHKRISRRNLGKIRIPLPPIQAQNRFVMFAKQVDKSKFYHPETSQKTMSRSPCW